MGERFSAQYTPLLWEWLRVEVRSCRDLPRRLCFRMARLDAGDTGRISRVRPTLFSSGALLPGVDDQVTDGLSAAAMTAAFASDTHWSILLSEYLGTK